MSLFSNLAMKQNLKHASGHNHRVQLKEGQSAFSVISSNTLVIGVDVVHPGGYHPSIAAMVGSVDEEFATFPGHIRLQPARAEILTQENMRDMAKACIEAYKARRGFYPSRILYYRDGVSDDQCHDVVTRELPEIERAAPAGMAAPSIVAIVVGKRHNTRFFPPDDSMTYKDRNGKAPATLSPGDVQRARASNPKKPNYPNAMNGNITPGLLVDSVITQPQMPGGGGYRDFFLQSHAALAGTARSAHYIVVRNDPAAKLTPAHLQRLSYHFCFNYARASKVVSYCAPAYYADRLCDRVHHYYRHFIESEGLTWEKTAQEIRAGDQGETTFRQRVRDEVATHPNWHTDRRTNNPWVSNFSDHMFWL
ncbi:uncharacterized protein MYCFIDRAFT_211505 [Pseudocercospora fijiensis CIRAD86]|uniref:Piwi domain-containing protein n=1 Tax=Pseudocercospora fijiensis (strain CIRAD86) TaxID=383855 RepID=M3AWW2_PSEFD|nr:uncharacterized protein MYCFIDRAFT_211505 [Pseudocercospora fijiensis CIRAD86]EME81962.1 hypothetical protein MYCFIDRAFT_211505 [Pseudocercospora fijiensis CIRAD86]